MSKKKPQKINKKIFFFLPATVLLLVLFIIASLAISVALYNHIEHKTLAAYTFSNTTDWGDYLVTEMDRYKTEHENFPEIEFIIPPYPKNTSTTTKAEIDYLLSLKAKRNQEKNTEIIQEQYIYGMYFNDIPLTDYFNKNKYSFAETFENSFWEISTLVLFEKEKFNRVRPHIIEPKLQPIIEVPPHPAYPSGHAMQAYFVALYLSDKFPEYKERYFQDADRIATNREVAGVHYPSDTAAGKLMAEQYFEQKK